MRILIISDIHANLTAFKAVLDHTTGQWESVWCLGDVVGYGPDPNECIELLKTLPHRCIAGNHDLAALGHIDSRVFSTDARHAIEWTKDVLNGQNRRYLASLGTEAVIEGYTLAHGSPREPAWEYILESETAEKNFAYFKTQVCFVGHTHSPAIYEQDKNGVYARNVSYNKAYPVAGNRKIINPGSVGQPRDQNPDAAYVLLDTTNGSFKHYRVSYDISEVQKRIHAANLPERLAARLSHGW